MKTRESGRSYFPRTQVIRGYPVGVSHNGNGAPCPQFLLIPLGCFFILIIGIFTGFTRYASHSLLSDIPVYKSFGSYFQCSSWTPCCVPNSSVTQGCGEGESVSWTLSPSVASFQFTNKGLSRTTTNRGLVAKHEICSLQILQIISSKPLQDKKQSHTRVSDIGRHSKLQ